MGISYPIYLLFLAQGFISMAGIPDSMTLYLMYESPVCEVIDVRSVFLPHFLFKLLRPWSTY